MSTIHCFGVSHRMLITISQSGGKLDGGIWRISRESLDKGCASLVLTFTRVYCSRIGRLFIGISSRFGFRGYLKWALLRLVKVKFLRHSILFCHSRTSHSSWQPWLWHFIRKWNLHYDLLNQLYSVVLFSHNCWLLNTITLNLTFEVRK